jgi:hypothetical protein
VTAFHKILSGFALKLPNPGRIGAPSIVEHPNPWMAEIGSARSMEGQMAPWSEIEPSLNELMQEPIIRAVMARDAVEEAELRLLFARVQNAYRNAERRRCAH